MEIFWFVFILQALICGILASNLADHKGYSQGAWFASGLFFGVLGLLAAVGLPPRQAAQAPAMLTKKCPDCGEAIRREAFVCKFCGMKFGKEQIFKDAIEDLQDKSTVNKLQSLAAIRATGDASAIPYLGKFIEELPGASEVVDSTIEVMVKLGGSAVSPQLVSALQKTGSTVKASKLIEALGKMLDPSSISVLVDSLRKPEVRDTASKALVRFGHAALPSLERFAGSSKGGNKKFAEQIIAKINQT